MAELNTGEILAGKYEILAVLGTGGMGSVYRAREQTLGRDVAIKVPRAPEMASAESMARFYREAKTCAKLVHDNIVQIYDYHADETIAYIVMEYVEGQDLRHLCSNPPADFQVGDVAAIFAKACDGLAFAHEHGVVHRDIKPANIMIGRVGPHRWRTKIMDFGIAHLDPAANLTVHQEALTMAGVALGTPSYMAPEQIRGQEVTPSTDLYALGCVLYYIFSREPPFPGTGYNVAVSHLTAMPPRLRERIPYLPEALDAVIQECLQKDPARRPASAFELGQRVQTALQSCSDMLMRAIWAEAETRPRGPLITMADATGLKISPPDSDATGMPGAVAGTGTMVVSRLQEGKTIIQEKMAEIELPAPAVVPDVGLAPAVPSAAARRPGAAIKPVLSVLVLTDKRHFFLNQTLKNLAPAMRDFGDRVEVLVSVQESHAETWDEADEFCRQSPGFTIVTTPQADQAVIIWELAQRAKGDFLWMIDCSTLPLPDSLDFLAGLLIAGEKTQGISIFVLNSSSLKNENNLQDPGFNEFIRYRTIDDCQTFSDGASIVGYFNMDELRALTGFLWRRKSWLETSFVESSRRYQAPHLMAFAEICRNEASCYVPSILYLHRVRKEAADIIRGVALYCQEYPALYRMMLRKSIGGAQIREHIQRLCDLIRINPEVAYSEIKKYCPITSPYRRKTFFTYFRLTFWDHANRRLRKLRDWAHARLVRFGDRMIQWVRRFAKRKNLAPDASGAPPTPPAPAAPPEIEGAAAGMAMGARPSSAGSSSAGPTGAARPATAVPAVAFPRQSSHPSAPATPSPFRSPLPASPTPPNAPSSPSPPSPPAVMNAPAPFSPATPSSPTPSSSTPSSKAAQAWPAMPKGKSGASAWAAKKNSGQD